MTIIKLSCCDNNNNNNSNKKQGQRPYFSLTKADNKVPPIYFLLFSFLSIDPKIVQILGIFARATVLGKFFPLYFL
jgi:hypothetical protein